MSFDHAAVKAIYFDLDDTLCGYWSASTKALRQTFETHATEDLAVDELMDHWAAAFRDYIPEIKTERWYSDYLRCGEITRTEQMRRALERAGVANDELAARMSHTYMTLRDKHLTLFPDALDVLDRLFPLYPLGLITNGPADVQRMEIQTLGIAKYFRNVFIEGEVGFGKPEPEVLRQAERAVTLPPANIMFVGNSYGHDIRPAIEAGWSTVWIRRPSDVPPSSSKTEPEQRPAGSPAPLFEITQLGELLPILGLP